MRALLESNVLKDAQILGGLRYGTAKLTAPATPFIMPPVTTAPFWWAFDPGGAALTVQLPPIVGALIPMEGRAYRISNIGTVAATITITRDPADGGGTVTTNAINTGSEVAVVNGAWLFITFP